MKGYKLCDPSTQEMIVRRDVVFVENDFDNSLEKNREPDEVLLQFVSILTMISLTMNTSTMM